MLFGYENEDGQIVDTGVCILTGRKFEAGDATFSVPGTKFFYHVSASAMSQHTEEQRAALLAQVLRETEVKTAKKSKGSE